MTLLEAMQLMGPPAAPAAPPNPPGGAPPGDRDDAAVVVWETLRQIRMQGFDESILEEARAEVFHRLFSRRYHINATTDFQARAYLRRAVFRKALDLVERAPLTEPERESEQEPQGIPPRAEAVLEILDDAVDLWGSEQFAYARERLLSQELLRRTVTDLVDIATGVRRVPDIVLDGRVSADTKEWERLWGAYKRRCQRTVRALVMMLPAVAVARGWTEPAFATLSLRLLADLALVADAASMSPPLKEVVDALVVVAKSYQRALVGVARAGS